MYLYFVFLLVEKVSKNANAHTICDSFFGVSGTIPRRTTYETGLPNHVRWSESTKTWSAEQEIMDERYLVARVRSKGLVVLTGCSHAGVINVCQDVKRAFGTDNEKDDHIFFVVGGFHLAGGSMETRIEGKVNLLDLCYDLLGYLSLSLEQQSHTRILILLYSSLSFSSRSLACRI